MIGWTAQREGLNVAITIGSTSGAAGGWAGAVMLKINISVMAVDFEKVGRVGIGGGGWGNQSLAASATGVLNQHCPTLAKPAGTLAVALNPRPGWQ